MATQICLAVLDFSQAGLLRFHAIFASYPLMVMALSAPFLGETVVWRRWLAVGYGFAGILVFLHPSSVALGSNAVIPLFATILMAIYGVLTRFAACRDNAMTSFFWTNVAGAVAIRLVVPFFWHPPKGSDWWWMVPLCITGASGHFCLIIALNITHASTIQPFAYPQLVFASTIGILIFDHQLDRALIIGSLIITGSGLFALNRERRAKLSAMHRR